MNTQGSPQNDPNPRDVVQKLSPPVLKALPRMVDFARALEEGLDANHRTPAWMAQTPWWRSQRPTMAPESAADIHP